MYSTIIYEKKVNYALITLNRPDKLNALNNQLFNELNDAIAQIEDDKEIRALIITGSGLKAFAAGADISELNACDNSSGESFSQHGSKVMAHLEKLAIPVIAAVNGYALGGGCELALSCHMRFASDNAVFGQPEVNLGILPGYGGTQRLPKLVGKAKAIEIIVSGINIKADEAVKLGLVNRVYPAEELLVKTIEFVNLIITKGPIAVSASLKAVNSSLDLSLEEGLALESKIFGEVCGSKDFKEGTTAFLEKRKAAFQNI